MTVPAFRHEEQTLIFERFHRRLGTSTEGSGLGLAIAQEIAHIHGGEISLYEDARRRRQHLQPEPASVQSGGDRLARLIALRKLPFIQATRFRKVPDSGLSSHLRMLVATLIHGRR